MTSGGVQLLRGLVDLLYPPMCPGCKARLSPEERGVCRICWGRLLPTGLGNWKAFLSHRRGLNTVLAGWLLEDVLQTLVHDLKYKERRQVAPELAGRLALMFGDSIQKLHLDVVVPVPLHPARLRERGFNQSDLLGRPLAAALGLPYAAHILTRQRNTRSQTALSVEERLMNVGGAFKARDLEDFKRVLLIDDVVTTGATLSSCADAIREAGGTYVAALTAATPFIESER
ncbi:MAG: ComF family protein [Fidelibacterota bacterium]